MSKRREKRDLSNYAEVKDRIRIFYAKYPDGRIVTELLGWENGVVHMQARVYKNRDDQKENLPCGVGHAYEEEDQGYVNKTSALENCETSAVGRALANAGISIEKSIASKQEMEFAMDRLERMKENGTFKMPAVVRRKYNELLKIGLSKSKHLDQDFLFRLANFTRGNGEWTVEAMEDAIEVVKLYDPNDTGPAMKKLRQIAQKQAMEEEEVLKQFENISKQNQSA